MGFIAGLITVQRGDCSHCYEENVPVANYGGEWLCEECVEAFILDAAELEVVEYRTALEAVE